MKEYMTVIKVVLPEGDVVFETHQRVSANTEAEAFAIKLQELLEKEGGNYYDYLSNTV